MKSMDAFEDLVIVSFALMLVSVTVAIFFALVGKV